LQIKSESIKIKEFAKIALDKKFENFKLQKLLLMTGDKKIFWNDKKDDILGIGENFVGNYLVEIRNELKNKVLQEKNQIVTIDNLIFILESNSYFKNWIENRVKEYSNNIKKFNNFTKNKYSNLNMKIPINYKFSKLVIDILYTQCEDIKSVDIENTTIPHFFIEIVKDNFRTNKEFPEILSLFWNNIYSIFYFIIKNLQNPNVYNIKQLLFKLEKIVTNQKNKSSVNIFSDRFSNCIFYALVKLLKNIYNYNEKSHTITETAKELIDPETRKKYVSNFRKNRHPSSLVRGNILSKSKVEKDTTPDMLYGMLGDSLYVDVRFGPNNAASIKNFIANRTDLKTVVLSWNIEGKTNNFDHILVFKEENGVRTLIGKTHSLIEKFDFSYNLTLNDVGNIRFILVPIHQDFSSGNSIMSNYILVNNAEVE